MICSDDLQQGENPRTNDWHVEFDPPCVNSNLPRDVSRRIGMWSSILHVLICDDMQWWSTTWRVTQDWYVEFDPPCADMRWYAVKHPYDDAGLVCGVRSSMCWYAWYVCEEDTYPHEHSWSFDVSIASCMWSIHPPCSSVDRYVIGRYDVHILCGYVEFDPPCADIWYVCHHGGETFYVHWLNRYLNVRSFPHRGSFVTGDTRYTYTGLVRCI